MAPRTHHRGMVPCAPGERPEPLGLGIFDVVSRGLAARFRGMAWGASRALNRRRPRHASRVTAPKLVALHERVEDHPGMKAYFAKHGIAK